MLLKQTYNRTKTSKCSFQTKETKCCITRMTMMTRVQIDVKRNRYMLSALGKNWCFTVEFVWITGEQEIVAFFVCWNVLLRWMDGCDSRLAQRTSFIVISVVFKLEKWISYITHEYQIKIFGIQIEVCVEQNIWIDWYIFNLVQFSIFICDLEYEPIITKVCLFVDVSLQRQVIPE